MNCMNTKYMKGRNRKPGGNKRQLFLQTDKRRKLPENIVYGVGIFKEQFNKKKGFKGQGVSIYNERARLYRVAAVPALVMDAAGKSSVGIFPSKTPPCVSCAFSSIVLFCFLSFLLCLYS